MNRRSEASEYFFQNSSLSDPSSHWDHLDHFKRELLQNSHLLNDFLSRYISVGFHDSSMHIKDRWEKKNLSPLEKISLNEDLLDKEKRNSQILHDAILKYFPGFNSKIYLGSTVCSPIQTVMLEDIRTSSHEISLLWFALKIQVAIQSMKRENKGFSVLEIGSGYGGLIEKLLCLNQMVKTVYLVDLPFNLSLQWIYFENLIEQKKFDINIKMIDEQGEASGCNIFFVPIDRLEQIQNFDIAINCRSFGEMTLSSIQRYFDFINQRIAEGGIFFNCNRISKQSSKEVVQIKHYPYGKNWKVMNSSMFPLWRNMVELTASKTAYSNNEFTEFMENLPPYKVTDST